MLVQQEKEMSNGSADKEIGSGVSFIPNFKPLRKSAELQVSPEQKSLMKQLKIEVIKFIENDEEGQEDYTKTSRFEFITDNCLVISI